MSHLIPQKSLANGTRVRLGNQLFVSVGGSLFEYEINPFYAHYLQGYSVRQIYIDEYVKLLSTYSGIIINDTIVSMEPGYANGYFCKIGDRYFLCSDHLYEWKPPDTFVEIPSGANVFAGYSRKLVVFQNKIYALNTKSINVVGPAFSLTPIHQGFEYFDMEVADSMLVFSTREGHVYAFNGKESRLLAQLQTRVRDVYASGNKIYLSSDQGVYTVENFEPQTLKQLSKTPFAVMVYNDPQNITWIATENGLYLIPPQQQEPILLIKEVEFNRAALFHRNDTIYAGSVEGLFVIDTYNLIRNFLPQYLNQTNYLKQQRRKLLFSYLIIGLVILSGGGIAWHYIRKKQRRLVLPQAEVAPSISLSEITQVIRNYQIQSVEQLAAHYHTNTVQLNRQFKVFDTTPGKFLKQVKISWAQELLDDNAELEHIATLTGYSVAFLKKELKQNVPSKTR